MLGASQEEVSNCRDLDLDCLKRNRQVRRWGKSRRGCPSVDAPSVVSRRQQTWEIVREMQISRPHPELWFGLSNLCAKPCRWFRSQIKSETHLARELFIQHLPARVTLQRGTILSFLFQEVFFTVLFRVHCSQVHLCIQTDRWRRMSRCLAFLE